MQGAAGSSLKEQVGQLYDKIEALMAQGVAKAMSFNVFSYVEADGGYTLICMAKHAMTDREATGWARRVLQETGFSVYVLMNNNPIEGLDGDECCINCGDSGHIYFTRYVGGLEVIKEQEKIV